MKLQLSATILKPLRDLTRRKSRSLLTILGIAVGVASLVAIVSTSRNLARAQAVAYADTTQADLTYWAWDVPAGLERILAALPNVAVVELRCTYYTRAQLGDTWYDLYFIGIDEFAAMRVNKIALREGRYPGPGEVLLEVSAKDLQPLAVGEQIIYRAGVDHAERPLTISGFAQSPAQPSAVFLNLVYAYAPASQVRRMLDIAGSNQVVVKLEDFGARNETIAEIRKVFAKRQIQYDEPRVRDPDYFEGKRELDALVQVMYAFSGLGLVISAFLVANTLAAVVAEQTREIGIMKSIGGARAHILRIYLLEAGLYGLFGAALGLALGTAVSWLLLRYAGWALNLAIEPRPSWPGLLLGGAMGLLAALLGGLGPARQAAGLSVREALGSHGITATYRLGWLDRLWEMWRSAPALVVMAARNLARRAGRHAVTLLFTAAATAALLAALSTGQSVNRSIAQIFDTYRADAWIWLGEVVSVHFAAELEAMPEVLRAEPWTLADAWVRLGKVRLWGLPAETQLYHPKLAAGRWYAPGEWDAAVISAELAEGRDIRLGETIEVDTGEAVRPFRVVGIAVDNAIFLGGAVAGKVFVPRETVERMVQRQGRSYFYALSLAAGDLRAADAALNRIERQFRDLRPVTESARRDMQSAQQQSRLLSISLYVMTVLIALAGGLGVMNTLTLNVLERRREIGVMRAIGASNANLAQVFLTEGLTLGAASWLLGLALAYPAGRILLAILSAVLFQIDYVFSPWLALVGAAFAILLSSAASLLPALGAARLPAQEALRYE
ncbi:MAG: ABC transporter permease [Chloroflexi bacterium]|nr:ABC transporter permease [Chloroflexota bacterium]